MGSLHKRKVPGSNPTVGNNFPFCHSRFAVLTGRVSQCKWNQSWNTVTFRKRFARKILLSSPVVFKFSCQLGCALLIILNISGSNYMCNSNNNILNLKATLHCFKIRHFRFIFIFCPMHSNIWMYVMFYFLCYLYGLYRASRDLNQFFKAPWERF